MSNHPKTYRIPKSFVLFGHKYRVEYNDTTYYRDGAYGMADENKKLITLQSQVPIYDKQEIVDEDGNKKEVKEYYTITDEKALETFFHELFHIVLDSLEEDQLSQNEKFVNLLGKAFLEVYLSSEYDEPQKT